mgnify:CR=1 FL=1
MASSAPAPRRGGNHSGQLQVMAARCASRIHGWFHGWDVYDRAVQHFFAHPSPNPPIFIEAGAYLGMSACFMSHLLSSKPHPARFVVLDTWGSLEHKRSSWLPEQDVRMIHALGKGDMMLAWAHNVRDMGSWNHISAVRRLSTLDAEALDMFANESVSFFYLDTSHGNHTTLELQAWWPRIAVGGWLCGDDWKRVQPWAAQFAAERKLTVAPWPAEQWCMAKGDEAPAPKPSNWCVELETEGQERSRWQVRSVRWCGSHSQGSPAR